MTCLQVLNELKSMLCHQMFPYGDTGESAAESMNQVSVCHGHQCVLSEGEVDQLEKAD